MPNGSLNKASQIQETNRLKQKGLELASDGGPEKLLKGKILSNG